ncbi:MAG: ATP-dependent helicase [Spirochaetia bacterium]|nr:ATP-dependent helicase [Spirochaetia bacterium]MCF7942225.1 ATP-dependent helicase [Spirochaetia bacterium]
MMNLSEQQKLIVQAPIGTAVSVLASAGSGKTRVLTERVRYLLQQTRKDRVIAITFTNKAAQELSDRLSDTVETGDRTWVSTIHSLAERILEQYGHHIGIPSELHIYESDRDRMEVFIRSLRDDGIDIDDFLDVEDERTKREREKVLQRYMNWFSRIKREMLTEHEVLTEYADEKLWHVYAYYQRAMVESGGMDFDDILVYAHKLLLDHEWIADIYRTRYKHICVDEAQDLNKIQYEFIKTLCGETITSIMMVGDEQQMIYGFNSSSSRFLCTDFQRDFSPLNYVLTKNYRSTQSVIQAANKLSTSAKMISDFALIGALEIRPCGDESEEALWIITRIREMLEQKTDPEIEGEISLDKMVVIARNRYVFSRLEKKLKEEQIPYSLRRGERVEDPVSLFGKVLDYGLKLKLNPKDWIDRNRLCALVRLTPDESWDEQEMLQRISHSISEGESRYLQVIQQVLIRIDGLEEDEPNMRKLIYTFKQSLEELATQEEAQQDAKSIQEYERALQELETFHMCWVRFRQKGLGSSLKTFRNAMALGQLYDNPVAAGLTLSTVHTMKGLEKDIVFIMGLCEGVFPDYRASSEKELEEERNTMFVAVTRAKRWLFLSYPEKRVMPWGSMKYQDPSRFMLEIID